MQNSSKVRKLIASAGALLVVGAGLTGCDAFGSGCSKGASTPEEAAETFITAAVADDAKKACSVGQKGSTVENVKPYMAEYRAKYAGRDLSKLTFENLPELQMGGGYVVRVSENGREIERIDVINYGRKYLFISYEATHENEEEYGTPASTERPSASTD